MATEIQDFTYYLTQVPKDSELAALCNEILVNEWTDAYDNVVPTIEVGIAVAAAAVLWTYACIQMDDLRNRKETREAEKRIAMVLSLQEEHEYTQEDAQRLVDKTLNAIRTRNKEDAAVVATLKIAQVVKQLLPLSQVADLFRGNSATEVSEDEH